MKKLWERFIELESVQSLRFILFIFSLPLLILMGLITKQIKWKDLL